MTRVDFYVLENAAASPHDRMICRVVEKAWKHGHQVFVNCEDDDTAAQFDNLLWQFQDTSFVPHGLVGSAAPVIIGTSAADVAVPDVLVNLASAVPATASSYTRVVESAGYDDATRNAARVRYRFYQDRGFPLQTHKIGG